MASSRRKARSLALQALYEWNAVDHDPSENLDHAESKGAAADFEYARELVDLVRENAPRLDTLIQRFAQAWPIDQVSLVDKNVLRIAFSELLFREDIPVKVAVSEAVGIAKSFGGDASSRFVNGVLGTFLSESKTTT